MVLQTYKEVLVDSGRFIVSDNPSEMMKAVRVATGIVVVMSDVSTGIAGMAHMALPDSNLVSSIGESPLKFVDTGLPTFLKDMKAKGATFTNCRTRIIGGAQLFNFGGGGGNILNIGTRNAITARTILTREGIQVEKTETGGNKPRTILFEVASGLVQVYFPGELPRYI